ncbi:uncharacterized protein LOC144424459 [Styela clava]
MKLNIDPKCRICQSFDETIDHIVSGCKVLAPTEYTERHNKTASYSHWKVCKHYHIPTEDRWYNHKPEPLAENENVTILWDFTVHTDKTIGANRPDIIVKDFTKKSCLLIDVAIPSERNTSKKIFEKLSKYKDLEIEIQKMWGLKTSTIPVVVGALGLIGKEFEKYVQHIPGNINAEQLQKTVLLGTAHILRKVLSIN